eukprot:gnl/Dysnectes_brevis/1981_a2280_602.p1 GENE.gnl/Dysnectes_brevis/1981_a2280_602~~gnl/Dysnectes_brevis/1981_a2280_602.p1  ORF type:complete len:1089 (-),score=186.22 gnl/Dysnectes_brevis/1981_a2280_602:35-3301(-)
MLCYHRSEFIKRSLVLRLFQLDRYLSMSDILTFDEFTYDRKAIRLLLTHFVAVRDEYLNPVLYGMEEGFRDIIVCQTNRQNKPVTPCRELVKALQDMVSQFRYIHFILPVSSSATSIPHYITFPTTITDDIATRPTGVLNPNPPLFVYGPSPLPEELHNTLLRRHIPAVISNHIAKPSLSRAHIPADTTTGAVTLSPARAPASDGELAKPTVASGRQLQTLLLNDTFRGYLTRWLFTRCWKVRKLPPHEKSDHMHEFEQDMLLAARSGAHDRELYSLSYRLIWGRAPPRTRRAEFAPNSTRRVNERCDDITGLLPTAFRPLSVLDIGCADGKILEELGHRFALPVTSLHGIDVRPPARGTRITFHEVSAEDPSIFAEGQFDLIVVAMTFHHIRGWRAALQNCHRWLRHGGIMVVREHDADKPIVKCMLDAHDGLFTLTMSEHPEQQWEDWAAVAHSFFLSRVQLQQAAAGCGFRSLAWCEDGEALRRGVVSASGPVTELAVLAGARDDWIVHGSVYYIAFGKHEEQGEPSAAADSAVATCRRLVQARDCLCNPLSYTRPVSRTLLVVLAGPGGDVAVATWRRSLREAGLPGSEVTTPDQLTTAIASYSTQIPVILTLVERDPLHAALKELMMCPNIPLICVSTPGESIDDALLTEFGWIVAPDYSDDALTVLFRPLPAVQFQLLYPPMPHDRPSAIALNHQFAQMSRMTNDDRTRRLVGGFWDYLTVLLGNDTRSGLTVDRAISLARSLADAGRPDHEIYQSIIETLHEEPGAVLSRDSDVSGSLERRESDSKPSPSERKAPGGSAYIPPRQRGRAVSSRSTASTGSRESRWVHGCREAMKAASAPLDRVRVVVDLGCGDGLLTGQLRDSLGLPKGSVLGLDVREPSDHSSFSWIRCDLEEVLPLPLVPRSVDLVVMSMMIHHIAVDARRRLLSEVSRILSPRGVLVVRDNDAELMVHSLMLDIQHGIYACVNTRPPEMSVAAFVSEFRTAYLSLAQLQRDARACGLHSIHVSDIRSDQFRKYWMVLGKQHAGDRIRDRDRRGRGGDRRGRGRDLGSMRPHIPPRDGAPMGLDQWSAARHRGRRKRLR